MLTKEVAVAATVYALTALVGLAATMVINFEGNQNASLPFAIFLYYGLWKIRPNERNRFKPLVAALVLMFAASLMTMPAHFWFPERVNWYDGPMGFTLGAVMITPIHYLTTYGRTANSTAPDRDN